MARLLPTWGDSWARTWGSSWGQFPNVGGAPKRSKIRRHGKQWWELKPHQRYYGSRAEMRDIVKRIHAWEHPAPRSVAAKRATAAIEIIDEVRAVPITIFVPATIDTAGILAAREAARDELAGSRARELVMIRLAAQIEMDARAAELAAAEMDMNARLALLLLVS